MKAFCFKRGALSALFVLAAVSQPQQIEAAPKRGGLQFCRVDGVDALFWCVDGDNVVFRSQKNISASNPIGMTDYRVSTPIYTSSKDPHNEMQLIETHKDKVCLGSLERIVATNGRVGWEIHSLGCNKK